MLPFCRTPVPQIDKEVFERLEKRVESGDASAIHNLGCCYYNGKHGLTIITDYAKAFELFVQAGELGCAAANAHIGLGEGVDWDTKKAKYYYELAAIWGDVARHNLGAGAEDNACNLDRALKHYMIAAGSGQSDSLKAIRELYSNELATKDNYTKGLRVYQAYLEEIKSEQRDEAAVVSDK